MTTNFPTDILLGKVKGEISNQESTKLESKEKDPLNCPHHFGYLFELPKNISFPEECLLCSRVVECIVPS